MMDINIHHQIGFSQTAHRSLAGKVCRPDGFDSNLLVVGGSRFEGTGSGNS